jgi:drug/metabolite transporter (DMT)-like permease
MPLSQQNQALRASVFMVAAMASFVLNDSCIKYIGATLPLGEIMSIRGFIAMVIIAAFCGRQGELGHAPQIFSRWVLLRSLLDICGTVMFLIALMHIPFANLTAILQSVPLVVVLLSVLFLGEKVGIRRVLAIVAGFIGVMLIMRPQPSTFTIYEGLALGIVLSVAVRDLVTKRIPAHIPIFVIALANAGFVTLGGVAIAFTQGFVPVALWQLALLTISAALLASGYIFMVATLRLGELSTTAPFRYSSVLFSIILGMVIFSEFPDVPAYFGMGLIIAAGLYAAHREAVINRRLRQQGQHGP